MADKRSYKETLASVETHFIYINNHLGNIDQHLNAINNTNLEQEVKIIRNRDRIGLFYKIAGGLGTLCGAGLIALLLKLLEIY